MYDVFLPKLPSGVAITAPVLKFLVALIFVIVVIDSMLCVSLSEVTQNYWQFSMERIAETHTH